MVVEVLGRMGIAAYIIGMGLGFGVSGGGRPGDYKILQVSIFDVRRAFEMLEWLRNGTITFRKVRDTGSSPVLLQKLTACQKLRKVCHEGFVYHIYILCEIRARHGSECSVYPTDTPNL